MLFHLHSCGLPKNSILCGLHRARLLLLGGGNTEELGLVLLVLTPTTPSTVPQMIFDEINSVFWEADRGLGKVIRGKHRWKEI